MWVKCHICKGSGVNPNHENSNQLFHEGTDVSFYQCYDCYIWYLMSNEVRRGYIWVDDTEDPISPLPSP